MSPLNSAMVIEVDQLAVRAVLFDRVDGVPRFVGEGLSLTTKLWQPIDSDRVRAAILDLEQRCGRRLASEERVISPQDDNAVGVDELFLTGFPVEVNRAAVISVGNGALGQQIVAAIRRTPTMAAFATEDILDSSAGVSYAVLLSWLREIAPRTLILVHDGGTTEDWDVAIEAAADAARDEAIVSGIVIADEARQQLVAQTLGTAMEMSGIDPLEHNQGQITAALESEFIDEYTRRVQSLDTIPALRAARYVDGVRSTRAVASFLHRRMHRNVVSLCIGSGSQLYLAAHGDGAALVRTERDLNLGARSLLRISPERVTRWMPQPWPADELTQWILNRALRPLGRPDSTADFLVESALRRELIADLKQEAGLTVPLDIDLIVVDPSFAGQDPALAAITVLDGIAPQPSDGVVTIALDAAGMMASIGAISTVDPAFARAVIEQDFLIPMVTCVVVSGDGEQGALAVRGEIKLDGGDTRRFSVPFGNVHLLDVAESEPADVRLTPEPGFAIGTRADAATVEFAGEQRLYGGRAGIIIDARGRPVQIPDEPAVRVARLRSWLSDVGAPID